jgi:dihydroneopterin aldolase
MTRLLISVASVDEAVVALQAGADIIDGKDAAAGPLAALPEAALREVVAAISGRCPVSATVGDWPAEPGVLVEAAGRIAATGVDWVKVGFYPGGDWAACLAALAPLARVTPLIGLLFADRTPAPHTHVAAFAEAGFKGVMLDTAGKGSGGLRQHLVDHAIGLFIEEAARQGLQSGVAGSLKLEDIGPLLTPGADRLSPGVLGFRGAACAGGRREAALDPARVAALRQSIRAEAPAVAG